MKTSLFNRITRALATASHLIIASPMRLPPKVIAVAKYVSLGAALLEAIGQDTSADSSTPVSTDAGAEADKSEHGKEDPDDGH